MTQHYELVYLLRVSVSPQEAEEIQGHIQKLLSDKKAEIGKFGEFGKRKLAYEIDHESHANYWLAEFDVETDVIKELHRMLSLEGRVLRFLITAVQPKTQEDIERERRMQESLEKAEMKQRQEKKVIEKQAEPVPEKPKDEKKEKLSLEELDEKLEELLDDESLNE